VPKKRKKEQPFSHQRHVLKLTAESTQSNKVAVQRTPLEGGWVVVESKDYPRTGQHDASSCYVETEASVISATQKAQTLSIIS
jgi:hypothetical protein